MAQVQHDLANLEAHKDVHTYMNVCINTHTHTLTYLGAFYVRGAHLETLS